MRLAPLVAVAALVMSGCGNAAGGDGELGGSITVSGSSTVEPISVAVAERFHEQHDRVNISVDGPGTGDGFELFCNGEIDINDASSKIKPEQIEACEENGVEFIELRVGNDGISMLVNEANEAVDCLNFADLYALTGPESREVDTWDAAEPLAAELGSDTDLPEADLDIVGPGEESGTFASYVEIVLEDIAEERGEDATTRPDYQASGDDNVILQGVKGSETALGWVGFAFAQGAEDVKLLPIAEEPGGPCVAPTSETIADGTYPISRPLFIYVNKQAAAENDALRAFVDFYLHEGIDAVSDVGYVSLSDEDLAATRAIWESRTTGAQ